jgi:predicted nucleotidyltransferase
MNSTSHTSSDGIAVQPVELWQAIERAAAILKEAGADAVYLFGSVAEGPLRPDSDIDLAVTGLPPTKFFQAMGQTLTVLPRPLDLVDLDMDTPFTRYLRQKGKLYRVA